MSNRILNVEFQVEDSDVLRAPKAGEVPTHVVATIQTDDYKETQNALERNRSLMLTEIKDGSNKRLQVIKDIRQTDAEHELPLLAYEVAKALGKTDKLEVSPSVKPNPNVTNHFLASADILSLAQPELPSINSLIAYGAALRTGYRPYASENAIYSINAIAPNNHASHDRAMAAATNWAETVQKKRGCSRLAKVLVCFNEDKSLQTIEESSVMAA